MTLSDESFLKSPPHWSWQKNLLEISKSSAYLETINPTLHLIRYSYQYIYIYPVAEYLYLNQQNLYIRHHLSGWLVIERGSPLKIVHHYHQAITIAPLFGSQKIRNKKRLYLFKTQYCLCTCLKPNRQHVCSLLLMGAGVFFIYACVRLIVDFLCV